MNIVEALNIAKEQGKKVRPKGQDCWNIEYKDGMFLQYYKTSKNSYIYWNVVTEDVMSDWEVVNEKPNKQTQYKIDSMKFQIVRHCANQEHCRKCILNLKCIANRQDSMCDDWSLKEIVEAYHILKEAGEI